MGKQSDSLNQFTDEKFLLSQIAIGDENSFKKIFDRYRSMVYSYAFKICSNQDTSEDILLTVFLKIWQHSNPASIENLKSYLQVATRNITFNALRSREIEARAYQKLSETLTESHNETEELILAMDAKKVIDKAVSLLPPQQKMVYMLCKEEGLKYDEVAERLLLSVATVKTHLKLALRFLRVYIQKNHDIRYLIALSIILNLPETPFDVVPKDNHPECSALKNCSAEEEQTIHTLH